jgi:glucose/arabinose dehydrogenase
MCVSVHKIGLRALSFVIAVVLVGAAPAHAQIHSEFVVGGLTNPVAFVQDPARSIVQYVVQQGGRIRPVVNGQLSTTDFLDLSNVVSTHTERGLLGLAFAPDYVSSRRFFVNFQDVNDNTVVARFVRSIDDPLRADPDSRFDLVWPDGNAFIRQPSCCHYGGNLAFGADGDLYIALGDGGGSGDPDNNAQNPLSLLGKMLRINVAVPQDDSKGYTVPADNPFVGAPGVLSEIWDAGLRNPWRYSFDSPAMGGTGALIVADVGQDMWEEFNYEPAGRGGRNFCWRNREGANDFNTSQPPWFQPLTEPTYQYSHDIGHCIIGGFVYRGRALGPRFYGRYFFGDFVDGRVWSMGLSIDPSSGEATPADLTEHTAGIGPLPIDYFASFGQDAAGELYVVSWFHGTVYRLAPDVTPPPPPNLADLTVYRPSEGTWRSLTGASNWTTSTTIGWGLPGDVPVRADLDGDGKPDLVVFRPSNATWYVLLSSSNYSYATWKAYQLGMPGDVPLAADFDGDGKSDLAVWRPSEASWYILFSSSDYSSTTRAAYQWGLPTDVPIVADIDGDGKADLVVYRPSEGTWYIRFSSSHYADWTSYQWGLPGDVPIAEDFDGDGKTDLAVWRPGNATWCLIFSSSQYNTANWKSYQWGLPGDVPVLGDFDRDGMADLAVWRPSNKTWYFLFSTSGYSYSGSKSQVWGLSGDILLPAR